MFYGLSHIIVLTLWDDVMTIPKKKYRIEQSYLEFNIEIISFNCLKITCNS